MRDEPPIIDPFRVKLLWESGYWDGVLSGHVELDGGPGYWIRTAQDYQLDEDGELVGRLCGFVPRKR